jgi:hypothetical protein
VGSTFASAVDVGSLSSLRASSGTDKIDDRTSTTSASVSAPLKAFPCELECVVQLAWSFVSNAFKLHAGMEFIRIAVFGQLSGNVLKRRCIRRINHCSKVGISLVPRLCPEPKSSEQYRSVFNEVVGGVHNEVVRQVRRRRPEMRPDLLLRLVSELEEIAHASACSIELLRRSPGLGHEIPADRFGGQRGQHPVIGSLRDPVRELGGFHCHRAVRLPELAGTADNGEGDASSELTKPDHALSIDHALLEYVVIAFE